MVTGSIITKEIPGSGERVPAIGLGTWQAFDVGSTDDDRSRCEAVLREFTAMGGSIVDTSPMYGRAEEVLGGLISKLGSRNQIFLATKVWIMGRAKGIEQMKASLELLETDKVDLIQVHNLVDTAVHLDTFASWKREGLVRYLGITHYTASGQKEVARAIERFAIDFIQINYSLVEREAEQQLLPLARERGLAVIANRPLAAGGLLARLARRPLPEWAGEIGCTSWTQVALKYVISHPAITAAIPATANVDHLRDNMGACYGPLPDDAMRNRIEEAAD